MGKKAGKIIKNPYVRNASVVGVGVMTPGLSEANVWYTQKQAKDEKAKAVADAEAAAKAAGIESQQAQIAALKEAEAQQEAVRKRLASLGRVQAGTAFNDATGTAQTKVFS